MPFVKVFAMPTTDISSDFRPLLRHGQAVALLATLGIRDAKATLAHLVSEGMVRTTTLKPNGRKFYLRDSIIQSVIPQ